MENTNNCFSVYYNFIIVDLPNKRQVRGSNTILMIHYHRSQLHSAIKNIIAQNLDVHGGKNLVSDNIRIQIQIVNVLDFPDSERALWQDNQDTDSIIITQETTF